ncbi:hypothetical protein GOP47_0023904 [Adiantum capillus-veneris]|uniref:Uncharacterized protein n=1 Tax=Adiantum capillus-veneris TaxID=13818 RepID=A0A9D4U4D9_ADICA|nr:hypothetical protein GOP47_0023904 [Adiantum capillus-veneris]
MPLGGWAPENGLAWWVRPPHNNGQVTKAAGKRELTGADVAEHVLRGSLEMALYPHEAGACVQHEVKGATAAANSDDPICHAIHSGFTFHNIPTQFWEFHDHMQHWLLPITTR